MEEKIRKTIQNIVVLILQQTTVYTGTCVWRRKYSRSYHTHYTVSIQGIWRRKYSRSYHTQYLYRVYGGVNTVDHIIHSIYMQGILRRKYNRSHHTHLHSIYIQGILRRKYNRSHHTQYLQGTLQQLGTFIIHVISSLNLKVLKPRY